MLTGEVIYQSVIHVTLVVFTDFFPHSQATKWNVSLPWMKLYIAEPIIHSFLPTAVLQCWAGFYMSMSSHYCSTQHISNSKHPNKWETIVCNSKHLSQREIANEKPIHYDLWIFNLTFHQTAVLWVVYFQFGLTSTITWITALPCEWLAHTTQI